MEEIFGGADWYNSRPEPEGEWHGVLRNRKVPVGPASRPAVSLELVTADRSLAVYAANEEPRLARYLGQPVVLRGKLVDLQNEGYGQELWIAWIRRAE